MLNELTLSEAWEKEANRLRSLPNPVREAFAKHARNEALRRWTGTHKRKAEDLPTAVAAGTTELRAFFAGLEGARMESLLRASGRRIELGKAIVMGFSGEYVVEEHGMFLEFCSLREWENRGGRATKWRFHLTVEETVWVVLACQWRKPEEVAQALREEVAIILHGSLDSHDPINRKRRE
ncbi:MAG: hypothetical protein Q7R85_02895 [bacterium]|nr:hypothetical protein [bacterium]